MLLAQQHWAVELYKVKTPINGYVVFILWVENFVKEY